MTWRPEWDDAPRRRFGFGAALGPAPCTGLIMILCIAVTVVSMVANQALHRPGLEALLALSPRNVQYVFPLLTYVFPHDTGSLWHIVMNLVIFWSLGRELEARLGRGQFLTLFFGAALLGGLAHLILGWVDPERAARLMGASGGVMALLFFVAREQPNRPFFFYIVPVPAKVLAGLFLLLDLFPLITWQRDGVSHVCHLAGAAFGWTFVRHPFDALAWPAAWRATARQRSQASIARREVADDAEMDRLLAKIHSSGLPSLTADERRFLEARSKNLRGG